MRVSWVILMFIRARYGHGGRLGYDKDGVRNLNYPAAVNSLTKVFI